MDFLARYSGKRPHQSGFNIAVSPEAMMLIGYVALQWAALLEQISFRIRQLRFDHRVPDEIRNKHLRNEAKYQIQYLGELGAIVYANERESAASEFAEAISRMTSLKGARDPLVHGTFALNDNSTPGIVAVHYKGKKQKFTTARLLKIGKEIGEVNAFLMDFDQWVYYERNRSSFETLLQLVDQQTSDHTPDTPKPPPESFQE